MILASKSPRRCELLESIGAVFSVHAPEVQEISTPSPGLPAHLIPQTNAQNKAAAAAQLFPDEFVLGADTMIIMDSHIFGKPQDLNDARRILNTLSGKTHQVITGMALINKQQNLSYIWSETTFVRFKELSPQTVDKYIAAVNVLDKAGAYAIQQNPDMIIRSIRGELENVIGLPIKKLKTILYQLNIIN